MSSVKRPISSRTDVFSLRPWRRSWERGPSSPRRFSAASSRCWPSGGPSWLRRGRIRLAGGRVAGRVVGGSACCGVRPVRRGGGQGGEGARAAVGGALSVGAEGAVDQDPVAGGVTTLAVTPGGPGQLGAVDPAARLEPAPDPVGKVFAVGVGNGEGYDPSGS